MDRIKEITKILPQKNCGRCGCGTCKSFAEKMLTDEEPDFFKCIYLTRTQFELLRQLGL